MLVQMRRRSQLAPEHSRKRCAVGEIEVTERRDRDVKLGRVDTTPEHAAFLAARQQSLQETDDRNHQLGELRRLLQMARAVQVLGVHETDELGMLEVITPDKTAELVEW